MITPTDSIEISNSRINTYNQCGKLHDYVYIMEIAPDGAYLSIPRFRGIKGHEALAVYYGALLEGKSSEVARKMATDHVQQEMFQLDKHYSNYFEAIKTLTELVGLLGKYFTYYDEEPFKVISVEEKYSTPIDDSVNYILILDLLVEWTKGEMRGEPVVIDHKFVYDFKSEAQLKMDGQQPKYIKALRSNGIRAKRAIFNQLRYRDLKESNPLNNIFRRSFLKSTLPEINAIWEEQAETALEIVYDPRKPRRIMNEYICKGCDFRDLCHLELTSEDSSSFIRSNFKKRKGPVKDLVEAE